MNGILIMLTLLSLVSAQHIIQCQQSPIQNPTKVNIENQHLIITGNALGEIGICSDSDKNVTTAVISVHSAPIVFIERYQADSDIQYVVVDQSGTMTIWNNNFTENLATLTLNATVIGAAIKDKTFLKRDARLALNCKSFIIELSLIQRKQLRRLVDNFDFLALLYSQNMLIASGKRDTLSKLIYFNQSGLSGASQFLLPETIDFLARRNDHHSVGQLAYAGLSSWNRVVQISQQGMIEMTQPLEVPRRAHGPTPASYFGYCRTILKGPSTKDRRDRRVSNGVLAIVYKDIVALRSSQDKIRWIYVGKDIVDISCMDEHLYVLTNEGKLQLVELWQTEFKSEIFVAGVGLSLIVLVFALVGYKVAKRWAKKKEVAQTCVQTDQPSKEIQLREFLIRENN